MKFEVNLAFVFAIHLLIILCYLLSLLSILDWPNVKKPYINVR